MRFCDLFISYKIGLKGIKSTIPFTKLPLYRKIFVIIFFASAIVSGILLLFKLTLVIHSISPSSNLNSMFSLLSTPSCLHFAIVDVPPE